MISNSGVIESYEACSEYSSEINNCAKRARHELAEDQKFKGVVPQQNGNWGAQIYAKHQRIWLGTFKCERDAAMAYDSATVKLRSGESHRNFPWNDQTVQEPLFQSDYSIEAVLSMIRNGTYPSKFATFLMNQSQCVKKGVVGVKEGEEQICYAQLFQKELTPSDVGKLNRLVIPKKHAITYFPLVVTNDDVDDDKCNEVVFYDKLMRLWKFRYCYWKSSQSYVFTRGWNRFVKDKKLKAKDTIVFYMCESSTKGGDDRQVPFSLIDVIYNNNNNDIGETSKSHCFEDEIEKGGGGGVGDTKLEILGKKLIYDDDDETPQGRKDLNAFQCTTYKYTSSNNAHRSFRLFGVSIN